MNTILFLVIGSLTLLIGGFIIGALTKIVHWRDDQVNWLLTRRNAEAWQKLADTYDLTYVPGAELDQARLFGTYRHCQLELKLVREFEGGQMRDFTHLTLIAISTEPEAIEVENIKSLLTLARLPFSLKGQISSETSQQLIYIQSGVEYDRLYLQVLFDYMRRLLRIYPVLLNSGDQFVVDLQTIARYHGLALQPLAQQILSTSQSQLYPQEHEGTFNLICPTCLTYYQEEINSAFELGPRMALGCRICGERQGYFVGQIVVVLDNQMGPPVVEMDRQLRVNWLRKRQLVDFKAVEIKQATDEEVERFIVQVGNDTDPARKFQPQTIPCLIAPECQLSDNTLKILRRIFRVTHAGQPSEVKHLPFI